MRRVQAVMMAVLLALSGGMLCEELFWFLQKSWGNSAGLAISFLAAVKFSGGVAVPLVAWVLKD